MVYTQDDSNTASEVREEIYYEATDPVIVPECFSATTVEDKQVDYKENSVDDHNLSGKSLQEHYMSENSLEEVAVGSNVTGTIIRKDPEGMLLDISYKTEAMLAWEEAGDDGKQLIDQYSIGDVIKVKVLKINAPEGHVIVSKRALDKEHGLDKIAKAYSEKKILPARVESAVKGGLIVNILQHRGFLPASHVLRSKDQPLESLIDKDIDIIVLDFDKARKKIIVSNKKAMTNSSIHKAPENVLNSLEAGMIVKGVVSSIKNFGVFVDLGGIEGLIHISELSWYRVRNPEELLKVGQEVDVFILGVDKEEKKVSLGYKQLFPDPWVTVDDVYKVGNVVSGKVSRIVSFGAFVELERGLEGLVHISEISEKTIKNVEEELSVGDYVKVKILRVIPEEKKIGLSIKAVAQDEELLEYEKSKEQDLQKNVSIGDAVDFDASSFAAITAEDDKLVEEVMEEAAYKNSEFDIDLGEVLNL